MNSEESENRETVVRDSDESGESGAASVEEGNAKNSTSGVSSGHDNGQ